MKSVRQLCRSRAAAVSFPLLSLREACRGYTSITPPLWAPTPPPSASSSSSSSSDTVQWATVTAPSDVESLRAMVEHLSEELRRTKEVVRRLVPMVDRAQHADDLAKLAVSMEGGGGFFIAETNQQLITALQTPGARIVLKQGHTYLLDMYEPLVIERTHVSIIGNDSTVVGSLCLRNSAVLDACDVSLFAPPMSDGASAYTCMPEGKVAKPNTRPESGPLAGASRLMPVISATVKSKVFLQNCNLINGRDGVYLGISSTAQLTNVGVRNCVRGVYEGVGCRLTTTSCAYCGNYYQLVLLGPDKEKRASEIFAAVPPAANTFEAIAKPEEVCPPSLRCVKPVLLKKTRADVALDQNPITDTYEDCYVAGKPVTLPEELSSAGLSDPVY